MTPLTTSLTGTWLAVRAELDGVAAPELALQGIRLQFTAREYRYAFGGEVADAGTWTAESTEESILFTFRANRGEHAGREVPAIAQFRGDRLRICYGLDGTVPRAFESSVGSARYLVTFRREAAHDRAG